MIIDRLSLYLGPERKQLDLECQIEDYRQWIFFTMRSLVCEQGNIKADLGRHYSYVIDSHWGSIKPNLSAGEIDLVFTRLDLRRFFWFYARDGLGRAIHHYPTYPTIAIARKAKPRLLIHSIGTAIEMGLLPELR